MEQEKVLTEQMKITPQQEKSKIEENQIFIGQKPFMKYVRAVEMIVREKGMKSIVIKARGQNISRAVDLAESVKNKFLKDLKPVLNISSHTEQFNKDGRDLSISVIEIILKVK